jgi:DnaJ-class molecular chaperone
MTPKNTNDYTTLNISTTANRTEIGHAFRELAVQYHPDKHIGEEQKVIDYNIAKFIELVNAYENLIGKNSYTSHDYNYSKKSHTSHDYNYSKKSHTSHDYDYNILNISTTANRTEIGHAFRELAVQYHPDKHIGEEQEVIDYNLDKFIEVAKAYEALIGKASYTTYDHDNGE